MFDRRNKLWWAIDGVLAGMGIPYVDWQRRMSMGGDLNAYNDDLPMLRREGIRAIVSLLNHPGDAPIYQSAGFEFRCLPIADGHPPSIDQAREYITFVDACRAKGLPVVTHCVGGIGRTGTMICAYLIHTGMTADEALAHARTREPSAVETGLQLQFLRDFEKLK